MVIEEAISINAPAEKIWKMFTDLTCWVDWNSVLKHVSYEQGELQQGGRFTCSIRPFVFRVQFEPIIEEIVPFERIVWSGSKYGIVARHEFIFQPAGDHVQVTSRETFKGITIENMKFLFPQRRIRELTRSLLEDLRQASEAGQ